MGASHTPRQKITALISVSMPPLTQYLGPWIKYPQDQRHNKKYGYEKKVMFNLIDNLPDFDYFNQSFHYSISNWLPFYWKGFNPVILCTYILDDLSSLESVYDNFEKELKWDIKKASKIVSSKTSDNLKDFYNLYKITLKRRGVDVTYSYDLFSKIDKKLSELGKREIFFATDDKGEIHSALYIIWDDYSSYLLASGEDPKFRDSCAGKLLHWEVIKYTKEKLNLNVYDFSGSEIESIEQVWRSFGATQRTYYSLRKINSKLFGLLYNVQGLRKFGRTLLRSRGLVS